MEDSVLTEAERRFLAELEARGVRYMIVGLTAAVLQGANTTTVDVDLWFENTSDPGIADAAKVAGGFWVSGFGMMPPALGGPLGDRFDVVNSISGLDDFATEFASAKVISVEGLMLNVLPLSRILASKDLAAIPALEEALAALEKE